MRIVIQADGKVLLGGEFTTLQPKGAASPTTRQRIARVNADGALDTGFDPKVNGAVYCVAVQPDGRVLLGGVFTALQPNGAASATTRANIARINGDGTLDTGFDPQAYNSVLGVAAQTDGKVLLGGTFTALQPNGAASPTPRRYIARVNADGTLDAAFDPNAGGEFPSVASVTVQADGKVLLGGRFTTLQPNGTTTPITRRYFARLYNDPVPPIEIWRQSYFGPGATNSGDAADTADPDHDGLFNLDEYARGSNPLQPANSPAPVFAAPTFTFTRNLAATDISLRVEATPTLSPAAWTAIATRAAGAANWTSEPGVTAVEDAAGFVTITDSVAPGAVPQRFLRLVVTHP